MVQIYIFSYYAVKSDASPGSQGYTPFSCISALMFQIEKNRKQTDKRGDLTTKSLMFLMSRTASNVPADLIMLYRTLDSAQPQSRPPRIHVSSIRADLARQDRYEKQATY